MHKLFVLLLLTFVNGDVNELIISVIEESFYDLSNICYVESEETSLNLLRIIFHSLKLGIKKFSMNETSRECTGYLVNVKSIQQLQYILEKVSFRVHSKLLTFCPLCVNESFTDQEILAYTKALNLVYVNVTKKALSLYSIAERKTVEPKDEGNFWTPPSYFAKINRTFKISYFRCPPFVIPDENGEVPSDGIEIRIINDITAKWPIQYVYRRKPKDSRRNLYGEMLYDISHRNADLVLCGVWVQNAASVNADFTPQFSTMCLTFLLAKPKLLPDITFPFQPFHISIWVASMAIIIFLFLVFNLLVVVVRLYEPQDMYSKLNVNSVLFSILRIFTEGPLKKAPPQTMLALRQFFFWLSIFCMYFWIYYMAGINLSLSFPRFENDIKSFEDIVSNNVVWEDPTPDVKNELLKSGDSFLRKLADLYVYGDSVTMLNYKLRYEKYSTLVRLLPEKYVMGAEELDSYSKEHTKVLKRCLSTNYGVFTLQNNSPFSKYLSIIIQKYTENGLVLYYHKTFARQKETRYMEKLFKDYSGQLHININLHNLQGIFIGLISGYFLALIVFVIEVLY